MKNTRDLSLPLYRLAACNSTDCQRTNERPAIERCAYRWTLRWSLAALCLWLSSIANCATITLQWNPPPETVTSYRVYQLLGTSTDPTLVAEIVTQTNTATVPLSTNQVSRFYVTAINLGGESPPSNVWTNIPPVIPPTGSFALSAPTLNAATFAPGATINGTARLTNGTTALVLQDGALTTIAPGATDTGADWTPRLPTQTVAPGAIVTLTGTWTIPSGPLGTWKVLMAVKVDGAWTDGPTTSFTVSATPPPTAPSAPTNLRAVKISSSRLDLGWTSDLTAITKLERSIDGAPFGEIDTIPAGTQHATTTFVKRKLYAFRARSLNSIGSSGYSNTTMFSSR